MGIVANNQGVKRSIRRLQHVKTWQLLILLVLFGFLAATFLRLNNIGMVQRREAVLVADRQGDPEQIKSRLFDLQRFVTSHMNTSMGTIYLESQYNRDSQEIINQAGQGNNPNGNIYKKAQEVCAPRFTSYSQAYLQCTVDYLERYNPSGELRSTVKLPKPEAYSHSFASPLWSSDFAGWSVLGCLLIIVMIIARFIGLVILRLILKIRNR